MAEVALSSNPNHAELRGQCNTGVCLLEAAMSLVTAVTRDGPKGNPFGGELTNINRQIMYLQQRLLRLHDDGPRVDLCPQGELP